MLSRVIRSLGFPTTQLRRIDCGSMERSVVRGIREVSLYGSGKLSSRSSRGEMIVSLRNKAAARLKSPDQGNKRKVGCPEKNDANSTDMPGGQKQP
jgi:hypothetical protein